MSSPNSLALRFSDSESLEMIRTIISYEMLVHDCSGGAALAGLVYAAAEIADYPDEVIECLRDICGASSFDDLDRYISSRKSVLLSRKPRFPTVNQIGPSSASVNCGK